MSAPACRSVSSTSPRLVNGRHLDELVGDQIHTAACKGCLPCEANHCVECGYRHLDTGQRQTCVFCRAAVGSDIRTIVAYARLLPSHALVGQHPEPRGELPMPGGDALVMLLGGSENATGIRARIGFDPGPKAYSYQTDPTPPLLTLATWEDDWRTILNNPTKRRATYATTSAFLLAHLPWAAQNHPAFSQFADELRTTVGALERALHAGERDDLGPPCMYCKNPPRLRRTYATPTPGRADQGGRREDWVCPKCRMTYDEAAYGKAEESYLQSKRAEDPWVPAHHVADLLNRPIKTVRTWVDRNVIRFVRDERGRLLVHWADTKAADLRARERAARAKAAAERRAARKAAEEAAPKAPARRAKGRRERVA